MKGVTSFLNPGAAAGSGLAESGGLNPEQLLGGATIQSHKLTDEQAEALAFLLGPPRVQERCHPSDSYTRGLEDMTNASLQRGRQG